MYANNNPIMFVDPNGKIATEVILAIYGYAQAVLSSPDLQFDVEMFAYDVAQGDYVSAIFDVVDILVPGLSGARMVPKFIRKFFGDGAKVADDIVAAGKTVSKIGDVPEWIRRLNENIDDLPDGWSKVTNNGRTHIRDENGKIRVRIDPPDKKTPYKHRHYLDENGQSLDRDGNIVNYKSPDAHIPLELEK